MWDFLIHIPRIKKRLSNNNQVKGRWCILYKWYLSGSWKNKKTIIVCLICLFFSTRKSVNQNSFFVLNQTFNNLFKSSKSSSKYFENSPSDSTKKRRNFHCAFFYLIKLRWLHYNQFWNRNSFVRKNFNDVASILKWSCVNCVWI